MPPRCIGIFGHLLKQNFVSVELMGVVVTSANPRRTAQHCRSTGRFQRQRNLFMKKIDHDPDGRPLLPRGNKVIGKRLVKRIDK
jgi:hypothetical protein